VDINGFFTSSSNQLYVFDPVALTPVAHYPIGNEPSIPIDLDWIGTNAYMTFFAQTNTQPGMHTLFGYYTNTWALNGTNINLDANLNESGSLTYNPLDNHIYLMESDIDTDVSILKCDLGGHVTPVVFFPTDSEGSPASSFAGYGNLMFYPGNYTNIGFAFNYQGSGTGNGFTNQFEFVDISGSTPGLRVDYNGDVMANRISTTAIGLDATNSTSYFAGQNPADGVVGLDSGKNMYIWGHTTGSVYFGNPANGLLNYDAAISGGGSFWFGGPSSRPLELWNDGSRWVLSIKGRFGGNSVLSNADNILPGQSNTFIVNNNGGALTNLQGSAITGTITGNGSQLTSLNANNFSSGTLPSAQLSGAYSSAVTLNNTANSLTGSFSGNGAGLTNTTTAANYVFACDTTTQTISTANTFQAIAFGAINQINGWTYAGDVFDCNQSGLYLIQYDAEVETTASSAITTTLRAVLYGTNEIAGSESVVTMSVANQPFPVSKSFMVSASFGATLVFNIASTSTSAELAAGNASGTTNPSISCTIIRIQ
jgi:hypothetical protein